jgi:hypothetical protein
MHLYTASGGQFIESYAIGGSHEKGRRKGYITFPSPFQNGLT